jgi:FkbM family methyltransferase
MLISFNQLEFRHGPPRGVIHIGAHLMEERSYYLNNQINNLLWIEANELICKANVENNVFLPGERQFNCVISDVDDQLVEFKITNNGQSSSILELDKHKIYHPHIYVTSTVELKTKRFDTLASENDINMDLYNFLNIDIQGAELLAIKSFGSLLDKIKYIYCEVNEESLYKDCALIQEIDEYLHEFTRVKTMLTCDHWGDAFYVRNK